jgi:hypothetical protein
VGARATWPGILSFALGLLTLAGLVTGIALATSDLYIAATVAAWAAIGAGGLGVLAAVVALIGRLGARWAVAGLLLSVLANPLVLTTALDLIGGLWA